MMESFSTIRCERLPGRLNVVLNRLAVKNAFDDRMIEELLQVFTAAAKDETLRVLVLSGEGKVFCAGADLNWMQRVAGQDLSANVLDAERMGAMFQALEALPMPTVSVIRGAALGGGTGLAAATDVALAEEGAKFGFTEVRLGIVPAVISGFLLRRIGRGAARRYFATGEIFDGRRAEAIGLISEAVPAGELDARAEAVIQQILSVGPKAARLAKDLVDRILDRPLDHAVKDAAVLIATVRASAEGKEGMAAFLEKRAPSWQGEQR